MCGILFAVDCGAAAEEFRAATLLMAHRGPDVPCTVLTKGRFMLGHNRLKVIELSEASNQPLTSVDGRLIIIFNGEIYNYRELARARGIELRMDSDTELLLELYRREGPAMLSSLNGMFAFVIVDTATGSYFMARDRLGVKPLYLYRKGSTLAAGSEIAAVLRLSGPRPVDPIGLRQYKKLRTFFNGRTLYSGIEMFPAGHYLLDGKLTRYWELPTGDQAPPADDELLELLTVSIKDRLIADVPIGSYLSGGLDSTIVTAVSQVRHSWVIGLPEHNEFDYARIAADALGTSHHEIVFQPETFCDVAQSMIQKRNEPLSIPNEVLLYQMSLAVKELDTVVMSGEGADELFFGYDRIFRWAAGAQWDIVKFASLYSYGSDDDIEIVEDAIAPFAKYGGALQRVAAFFQIAHLHGLLRRLDNSTMLCGVEAREPFVDYRLIERMAGVPFEFRMQDGVVKAPLKRVFADVLPQTIIQREKVGFPVDLLKVMPSRIPGKRPFDKWTAFNLQALGISEMEYAS